MIETEVERGWSHRPERQFWRFLARNVPSRRQRLRGAAAIASITFDDVPDNAASVGAPILERRGIRGTFYVATALCGRQDRYWRVADRGQVRALSQSGHEIGCHTARHINVQSLRGRDLLRECDLSRETIAEICGERPRNFCYPFGDVGLSQKRLLSTRFETCRTIYETLNAGRVDLAMLGAYGLFDAVLDRRQFEILVRRTVAQRGWLILYTHDVSDQPTPMGVTPQLLDLAISVLADHGVPVVPVAEASRYHGLIAAD